MVGACRSLEIASGSHLPRRGIRVDARCRSAVSGRVSRRTGRAVGHRAGRAVGHRRGCSVQMITCHRHCVASRHRGHSSPSGRKRHCSLRRCKLREHRPGWANPVSSRPCSDRRNYHHSSPHCSTSYSRLGDASRHAHPKRTQTRDDNASRSERRSCQDRALHWWMPP